MPTSLKLLLGPQDTDFGIARLVLLPDGTDRIEVFDEAGKVWRVSSNPDLTLWDLAASEPLSPALATRLGLTDPDTDDALNLPPVPTLGEAIPGFKRAAEIMKNRQVKPELKRQGDKIVQAVLANLNYNVLHDIDPDAPEAERQAAYARLRNEEFGWLDLPSVVRPETLTAIEQNLGIRGWQIADRWAAGAPVTVRRMETDGTLLERLKEQAALEAETVSRARIGGQFQDVPDSELLAMNEIPALPD